MFVAFRELVCSIITVMNIIRELLQTKLLSIEQDTSQDEVTLLHINNVSIMIDIMCDTNILVDQMLDKLNNILDVTEMYLENLINHVPHYDEITKEVTALYGDEEEDEDYDSHCQYPQVYLDNLINSVKQDELSEYTYDNGKTVLACRSFIPPATIQLNYLLSMFQQLNLLVNTDDLVFSDVALYCGNINAFTQHFSAFIDKLKSCFSS